MIRIDQPDEPDLETVLNGHPATREQIQAAGLRYCFTWGYENPVYKDPYDALCAFEPKEEGIYKLFLYIEDGE